MQTSELFQNEHIQVKENWQENVVTALSYPTAVGISNINEWEELFLPQVAVFLIYIQTFPENIQNAQASLMTKITQTTVMMSGGKTKNDRLVSQILCCNNQISLKFREGT